MTSTINSTGAATRASIRVSGIVQGVGFRPFVHREATARGLAGSVINTAAGVEIEAEGPEAAVADFMETLRQSPPPRAAVTGVQVRFSAPEGRRGFHIEASVAGADDQPRLVGADSCTCDDCLAEMRDPANRRYRYPFVNCTNCGPRFTIIAGLPYDRPLTTMSAFEMCPSCRAEYEDPGDRRFHAEPNACPECGPRLWLADADGNELAAASEPATEQEPGIDLSPVRDDPIGAAAAALRAGKIIAIKGLGGFQLVCLATSAGAITRLRRRKRRPHKPFAVMMPSLPAAANCCDITPAEAALLEAVERPIVLLARKSGNGSAPAGAKRRGNEAGGVPGAVAAEVAPGLDYLGVMLPYTPLHSLLMDAVAAPLVMTSGNLSEEPICRTNAEALERLGAAADLFLLHDREILSTYDDSVVAADHRGRRLTVRRARGYAPLPLTLPATAGAADSAPPLLAAGGDLKSAFCLTRGRQAYLSQHIGDLENAESLNHYERTVRIFEGLFGVRPGRFAADRHPGYLSTEYARGRARSDEPVVPVQHHHAHIAACLAEHGISEAAAGVALDGTGLGEDGAIWGGEFFSGSIEDGFEREAHLRYFPLPGGDAAIREPWRAALALVWSSAPEQTGFAAQRLAVAPEKMRILEQQLKSGANCHPTSSCGRLFDGVAALVLGRTTVSFEAQAAMELEAAARCAAARGYQPAPPPGETGATGTYRFFLDQSTIPWTISPAEALRSLLADLRAEADPAMMALRFHLGLADVIVRTAAAVATRRGLKRVALGGGVWLNRLLLELVDTGLSRRGLTVIFSHELPPGDGGLALGQAALALADQTAK